MPVVPQAPAPKLFGYEVADDINKNKSLLSQCTEALEANGVHVVLPPSFSQPDVSKNQPGTPYASEIQWVKNLQAACPPYVAPVNASLVLQDATPANLLAIAALAAGSAGNSITVAVAAGTASGVKITIVKGLVTETYDNLASVAAAVAAIHGVSALVDAIFIAEGTLAVLPATNLLNGADASGVQIVPPTFAIGENDNQSIFIARWAKAIFDGLRAAGYIV